MDPLIGYVAAIIVSLVTGLLLQRFADKPDLTFFLPGPYVYELKNPVMSIRTDSLTLQNFGRKPATNIEIVHKEKPDHFQFSQAMDFTEEYNPSGEHLTKIASLGPKEFVNIQYLSHLQPPVLLSVRSDHGQAKLVQVHFQKVLPRPLLLLWWAVLFSGIGALFFLAIKASLFIGQIIGT